LSSYVNLVAVRYVGVISTLRAPLSMIISQPFHDLIFNKNHQLFVFWTLHREQNNLGGEWIQGSYRQSSVWNSPKYQIQSVNFNNLKTGGEVETPHQKISFSIPSPLNVILRFRSVVSLTVPFVSDSGVSIP
jgi:hypothetical protein